VGAHFGDYLQSASAPQLAGSVARDFRHHFMINTHDDLYRSARFTFAGTPIAAFADKSWLFGRAERPIRCEIASLHSL